VWVVKWREGGGGGWMREERGRERGGKVKCGGEGLLKVRGKSSNAGRIKRGGWGKGRRKWGR